MGSPWEPSRPDLRGLTVSPRREPDSTYFDLPQPGRGRSSAAGSAGDSLDVFHMQGMNSPVMVSSHGGCTSGHRAGANSGGSGGPGRIRLGMETAGLQHLACCLSLHVAGAVLVLGSLAPCVFTPLRSPFVVFQAWVLRGPYGASGMTPGGAAWGVVARAHTGQVSDVGSPGTVSPSVPIQLWIRQVGAGVKRRAANRTKGQWGLFLSSWPPSKWALTPMLAGLPSGAWAPLGLGTRQWQEPGTVL